MKNTYPLFVLLMLIVANTFAQSTYDNNVFQSNIKSVEFYNSAKQSSFPAITLGSGDKLLLAFDDLQGGSKNFSYTIEHCDMNWNSSNLSTAEYLKNYTDDKITDFSYSVATVQKYTHYQLKLPNQNVAPKIAGNYILKVYEDDSSKPILTRRMYVIGPKIALSAEIVQSGDVSTRLTNQKINFTLDYGTLRVQNPGNDVRTIIMQNARSETAQLNNQPTYIQGTKLIYNDITLNDFPGGNEFRHFDTRTLKLNSERILHITREDTSNTILLLTDPDRNEPNYSFSYDLNGAFYILNQDGTDPHTDADYAHMYFTLNTKRSPNEGTPYIVGQFNDYKVDDNSKMVYYADKNRFAASILLKQGVYDYTYVWVDKAGKQDDTALEGSFFQTENDYQLLVYYHPAGARWDELVGYTLLNTTKKQ
ncbi:uncharacterized protein DUF5103 [Mucilaginibacter frigoritolerans]|uniref:Uncharacterized protein DUF5103 n=1 Tax=Mucilaginibacter frigoritolerans TaxID=652788 RepID=A0A562UFS4_9SPHI|nr:DUF5103 domain-containing protein [Mucilaginibacter frigoritolerans]TWJ04648.1 uncharacterized protein DUF5103 [Mucilaginibacter frigoritolerans]